MGRVFRIDFGYDGTSFAGSQRQPGSRTVQGELESTLRLLTGAPAALALAGRTDRGVHAVGQVGSGALEWSRGADALRRGLEALTPDDIAIYGVTEMAEAFHARYDATAREYRYRVWSGSAPLLLGRRYVTQVRRRLDLTAMQDAARALVGAQDFAALAGSGAGVPWSGRDCRRTVKLAEWGEAGSSLEPLRGARLLEFRIVADGFLPQMVRNAVGALLAIGRGERDPSWLVELIARRDRRNAPAPAAAGGLVLWHVAYTSRDNDADAENCGASSERGVEFG